MKKIHKKFHIFILVCLIGLSFNSCNDWLDIVPDGVPTLEMVFNSRDQALKYLGTCYAYMPREANTSMNPAILGSDELWAVSTQIFLRYGYSDAGLDLLMGMQNPTNPILENWWRSYQALYHCNTFLENVGSVPDLKELEREQWKAEVMVMKAYYHYMLVQWYGPIPLIRENIPVSADVSAVQVPRAPVDECFQYIVELLDEACTGDKLPMIVPDPSSELGRITKPMAMTLKAKVLVTAASPLFNGNNDQATLRNNDGTPLFNQTEDPEKWQKAVTACREAIETCHEAEIMLYEFPNISYTDTIALDVTLRNAFSLRWNSEIIWANTQSMMGASQNGGLIYAALPKLIMANYTNVYQNKYIGIPLKVAAQFYTDKGVPLTEDRTRDISKIYDLRTAQTEDRLYIREGRTTIDFHFDREPRFYAWVGFDGGIWFGAGQYNDQQPLTLNYLALKWNETDGGTNEGNRTGYHPKKWVPFEAQIVNITGISAILYPWPAMRLSDLYLLYAEAINEAEGPSGASGSELFKYIDMVRARAGLKGVKESWDNYANNKKYENKNGMREIIQQERMIELSFEGQRFWDVRRWKIAYDQYRTPIQGWNMKVATTDGTDSEVNRMMYTPQTLYQTSFSVRDYFWPIKSSDLDVNPNLVQNIGW